MIEPTPAAVRGYAPGVEVGGYRILTPLGSGAMGSVYSAHDGGGNLVAIKFLHAHLDIDASGRDRLLREATALRRLHHPAVAQILDLELDGPDAFIVTELIAGRTLEAEIAERGPLDSVDLFELADQLAAALDAVHDAGVVHRDIKPGNVLIADHGPVLIDFGIAQGLGDFGDRSGGTVMGTPGYLAPELLDGAPAAAATDWWGWAAALAFAATGRAPFGLGPTSAVLARAHAGRPDLAGIGRLTEQALAGALRPVPGDRLRPGEVVARLRRAADDGDEAVTEVLGAGLPGSAWDGVAWDGVAWGGSAWGGAAGSYSSSDGSAGNGAVPSGWVPAGSPGSTRPDQDAPTEVVEPNGGTARVRDVSAVHDGRTMVVPVDAARASARAGDDAAGGDSSAPGAGGLYAPNADDPAAGRPGPGSGPPPYRRPEPARRLGALFACVLVVVAVGLWAPVGVLIGLAAFVVVARFIGVATDALHRRRERRGPLRVEGLRLVGASPWYLLRAVVGAVPSVLVAACAGYLVLMCGWWFFEGLVTVSPGADGRSAPWVFDLVLGLAALAAVVMAWLGPLTWMTRYGTRTALARVARGRLGTAVLVVLALAVVAVIAVLVAGGRDVVWWPFPGAPRFG